MKPACIFALILGFGLVVSCQPGNPTDDPEKLKEVLFNYFDGIKNRDTDKMIASTTPDFILYEEGKAWTNDSVFKEMKRFPYRTAEFKFDNFIVNVDSRSGYMSYYEQAGFVLHDSTTVNLKFLGSAAFKKDEKGWRMSFLHSTDRYKPKKKVKLQEQK